MRGLSSALLPFVSATTLLGKNNNMCTENLTRSVSNLASWPWLAGQSSLPFLAPPIAPIDQFDDRQSVEDLIDMHRKSIDKVRVRIQNENHYNGRKHDDLWILRFVLTHQKTDPAVEAAKTTLEFRAKYKLDEKDIRYSRLSKSSPPNEAVKRYLQHCEDDALSFVVPDKRRGVVAFFRPAGVNQNELCQSLDELEWTKTFIYLSEWTFQWLDYTTRTTGRLTKLVRLVDMKGFSLSQQMNREAQRRHASVAHLVDSCYPQLDQSFLLINTPRWIKLPLKVLRPLFPKRMVEKVDLIDPARIEEDRKRVFKFISRDHLPSRFGGKNGIWPLNGSN